MKTNFKVGEKVQDSWYFEAGTGIIKEVLKTRMKIFFNHIPNSCALKRDWSEDNKVITYDRAHYQFLRKV